MKEKIKCDLSFYVLDGIHVVDGEGACVCVSSRARGVLFFLSITIFTRTGVDANERTNEIENIIIVLCFFCFISRFATKAVLYLRRHESISCIRGTNGKKRTSTNWLWQIRSTQAIQPFSYNQCNIRYIPMCRKLCHKVYCLVMLHAELFRANCCGRLYLSQA